MGLFDNELYVNKENPFANDKLQRQQEIENLTSIFNAVGNKMVLAINSQWGTGKTSFLKMWNQHLMNIDYKTIFFNAWENDFVEDPFIAFVNELKESINDESKVKGFMEKAKDVGLALAKYSPKVATKIVKQKTGFDVEEIISSSDMTKLIGEKIDKYKKSKDSVLKFRKELKNISSEEFHTNQKPLVIFVDELDRCRPDYAITLLERIKHLFNVDNIIFILGIDKEALSNSIKVIYGEQTDINGYLTRFIDLEYKLNNISKISYVNFLLEKYNFKEIFTDREKYSFRNQEENSYSEFTCIIQEFIINFDLTLRDTEKVMITLNLILKVRFNKPISPYLCIFLLIVKKLHNELYYKIKVGSISYAEVMRYFQQNKLLKAWFNDYSKRGYILKAFIILLLNDISELETTRDRISSTVDNYNNPDRLCVDCYNRIKKDSNFWNNNLRDIFTTIDLYDNLTTLNNN